MDLKIIPFAQVEAVLQAAEDTDQETTKSNTHFHSHAEIAAAIPEPGGSSAKHVFPDLTTGHFSHWIDLIASLQGFNEWHEITLPPSLVQELLDANAIWTLTGRAINKDTIEDLLARFPKRTSRGTEIKEVFNGQREWFMRLAFCSTKDARGEDSKKYGSFDPDGRRRAAASLPGPPRLLFVPHNKHMDTSREFRVFCPPEWTVTAHPHDRIAAISQYRWHAPYHRPAAAQRDAEKVFMGAQCILARILAHAAALREHSVLQKMLAEGFVFDVFEDLKNGDIRLLEINPFGAMSGCGSCLFHWIEDADLLYGKVAEVEVRLAM